MIVSQHRLQMIRFPGRFGHYALCGWRSNFSSLLEIFCYYRTKSYSKMDELIQISFPDRPVYLQRAELKSTSDGTESRNTGVVSKYLVKQALLYVAFPKSTNEVLDNDNLDKYIQNAVKSDKLYKMAHKWDNYSFSLSYALGTNFYRAPEQGHIKRGICLLRGASVNEENNQEKSVLAFMKENDFSITKFTYHSEGILKAKSLLDDTEEMFKILDCEKQESPVFCTRKFTPVFQSYETAREVLQKCSYMKEVQELLTIVDKNMPQNIGQQNLRKSNLSHPFVVVEGMDATGKTTLTQILEDKLKAARYYTPPPHIQHLRPFFDTQPEIVRRAYYCMGNYIVAMEIIRECETRPVIMDRYWHSTTAYGIANESSSGDQPESGHMVYQWPCDLLEPTLVLFLTVSEEVRQQRMSGRGGEKNFEEKSLDKDQYFRKRLCEAYRRMTDPACVEIDASGTVEEVVQSAITVLRSHNVHLDDKQDGDV